MALNTDPEKMSEVECTRLEGRVRSPVSPQSWASYPVADLSPPDELWRQMSCIIVPKGPESSGQPSQLSLHGYIEN